MNAFLPGPEIRLAGLGEDAVPWVPCSWRKPTADPGQRLKGRRFGFAAATNGAEGEEVF